MLWSIRSLEDGNEREHTLFPCFYITKNELVNTVPRNLLDLFKIILFSIELSVIKPSTVTLNRASSQLLFIYFMIFWLDACKFVACSVLFFLACNISLVFKSSMKINCMSSFGKYIIFYLWSPKFAITIFTMLFGKISDSLGALNRALNP